MRRIGESTLTYLVTVLVLASLGLFAGTSLLFSV